jgi:aspartate racemase
MKTLGLIGGLSWESTAVYYRLLNRIARERLGGHHSAELLMYSVDFAPIAAMHAAGDWPAAAEVMIDIARRLERGGAEAILICSNTMHKTAGEVRAAVAVPLIDITQVTASSVRAAGVRRPLLLGTRFTMEQDFYVDGLNAGGVTPTIPPLGARQWLHEIIYDELVQGRVEPVSRRAFVAMVDRAVAEDGVDGVILGCTELGLLVGPDDLSTPTFDTTELHARAAMDFALG